MKLTILKERSYNKNKVLVTVQKFCLSISGTSTTNKLFAKEERKKNRRQDAPKAIVKKKVLIILVDLFIILVYVIPNLTLTMIKEKKKNRPRKKTIDAKVHLLDEFINRAGLV